MIPRPTSWLVLLGSSGCATSQPAGLTRQVSPNPEALATRPICFAPPPPTGGLIAQRNAADIVRLCESAAEREHVAVVPFGRPGCAVAMLAWSTRATGQFEANCSMAFGIANCGGSDVRKKLVRVTIVDGPNGAPLVETRAALRSTSPGFSEKTFFALCRVAFRKYPEPLKNYQFDAQIDDVK